MLSLVFDTDGPNAGKQIQGYDLFTFQMRYGGRNQEPVLSFY